MGAGYHILDRLGTTAGSKLYRARRREDEARVLLKLLEPANPTSAQVAQFRSEYDLLRELHISGVAKPIAFLDDSGQVAMALEDFDGQPLEVLFRQRRLDLLTCLRIADQLTRTLAGLHAAQVIHQDIRPTNLLIGPEFDEICLVDFSRAIGPELTPVAPAGANVLAGDLAYLSPEQTGRMKRLIDERTDLYSLGVMLYRMLTGRLPFQANDPLEWVHCHIARVPRPPALLVPEIPPTISDVVMKLLAKEPQDRYQSAHGLQYDLDRCLRQGESAHQAAPFVLGKRDVSDRFLIPERLYGRGREVATLLDTFERMAVSGRPEFVLVSGHSGIGKSSLVHELHRPIVGRRGYFLAGKFDQHKPDIPYGTISEAFRGLIQQILTGAEEEIARRKQQLEEAMGNNGQIIIDLIPQVELILGRQPLVPDLPPLEAQNRFHLVFRQFLGVFAAPGHPLTLFLDDLQWADAASLYLLEHLITHPQTRYLLLVGAYRNNEVKPSHPLMQTVALIRGTVTPTEIRLGPLDGDSLCQLVADTLHCESPAAKPLADLIARKTAGNPFFVNQFLQTLHQDKLIAYDPDHHRWCWDTERIHEADVSDNVIELMADQISRLGPSTRETLKAAACVGYQFDLGTLALITERPMSQVAAHLRPAVRKGLLVAVDGSTPGADFRALPASELQGRYRWLHDRVQQAAYSLIPLEQHAEVHLKIGRLLFAQMPAEEIGEKVFDIANHFNRGSKLLNSQDEKDQVAGLNLSAGRKAKAGTAYASALRYVSAGQALLSSSSWETQYQLSFGLHMERAWCERLCGHFEAAVDSLETLLNHARNRADQAAAYRIKIDLHTTRGEVEQAALTTLTACSRLFDMDFPLHPTRDVLQKTAQCVRQELGERTIESLFDLPVMTDPDMQAAVALLSSSLPAAYFTDPQLHDLMCCQIVNLTLRCGNTDFSPHGYVTFGATLGRLFEQWDEGYRFGRLAQDLVEKREFSRGKASTYYTIGAFVNCWVKHARLVLPLFHKTFQSAVECGDMNHACYAAEMLVIYGLVMGDPLAEVAKEAERQIEFTGLAKYEAMHDAIVNMKRLVQTLRGISPKQPGDSKPNVPQASIHKALHCRTPLVQYTYKTLTAFLSGNYEEAVAAAFQAKGCAGAGSGMLFEAETSFYAALALSAHHEHVAPEKQKEYLETLATHQERFRTWQRHCPQNFLNRYALISAEIARIRGRDMEAMRLYEQAIQSARENGFVHNEGIASERAGRFYQERGFETIANTYLRAARACYLRWGADGKVRQLDASYPQLGDRLPVPGAARLGTDVEQLDFLAVVKASQAISDPIVLEQLLDTLMRVVLENAGAQKGCLLLTQKEGLAPVAEASVDGPHVNVRVPRADGIPQALVPLSVLNYVRRTRERVILDNACEPNSFSEDEYFLRACPKSLLCLPIIRQATLVGLLYLENSLVTHAFTTDRLAVLELLASQAAISLENARLYSDLQRENVERKQGEMALRDSEERFFKAFHASPAPMAITRRKDRAIIAINDSLLRTLGYTREEVLGHSAAELSMFDEEARQKVSSILDSQGPIRDMEIRLRTKTGLSRLFLMSLEITELADEKCVLGSLIEITERKLAEEALRASEANYRTLVEAASDGIFIADPRGFYIDVNTRGCEMLGYTREEILALHIRDVVAEHESDRIEPEVGKLLGGQSVLSEWIFKRKDGLLFPGEVSARRLPDGRLQGIVRDITERKKTQAALLESEARYRTLVEHAPEAIVVLDVEKKQFIEANENAVRLFGLPRARLLKTGPVEMSPPSQPSGRPSLEAALEKIYQAVAGEAPVFDWLHRSATGEDIPCEVRLVRLPASGRVLIRGSVTDISERKKAEALRDGQSRILEMIATSAPLEDTLTCLARVIECQVHGMLCSVLLLDKDGLHVRHGAAPSLPIEYTKPIDGACIGPRAGSCGTAMYFGKPVIVTDILRDPLWDDYRSLAAPFGLRACWSTPILSSEGKVLGSFAMYYREVRSPTAEEVRLLAFATHMASVAIEQKRTEEQVHASLREKEVLLKEIHHRVKNNLQLISSLLNLQAAQIRDPASLEPFIESQNRVRSMALVHEHLYQSGNLATLALAPHVENLCAFLYRAYGVDVELIELQLHIADVALDLDQAVPCGLIINELVSNALKYAFPDSRPGRLSVELHLLPEKRYSLVVSDNGIGLPENLDPFHTRSLGLQLVHDLTQQLRGTLAIDRSGGTRFTITFGAA